MADGTAPRYISSVTNNTRAANARKRTSRPATIPAAGVRESEQPSKRTRRAPADLFNVTDTHPTAKAPLGDRASRKAASTTSSRDQSIARDTLPSGSSSRDGALGSHLNHALNMETDLTQLVDEDGRMNVRGMPAYGSVGSANPDDLTEKPARNVRCVNSTVLCSSHKDHRRT